jgi:hypothetical protein
LSRIAAAGGIILAREIGVRLQPNDASAAQFRNSGNRTKALA